MAESHVYESVAIHPTLFDGSMYQATSVDHEFSLQELIHTAEEALQSADEYTDKSWMHSLRRVLGDEDCEECGDCKELVKKFIDASDNFVPMVIAVFKDKELMHKLRNTAKSAESLESDKDCVERAYELVKEPDIQENIAKIYGAAIAGMDLPDLKNEPDWYEPDDSLKEDCDVVKLGFEDKFLGSKEYEDVEEKLDKAEDLPEDDKLISGNGSIDEKRRKRTNSEIRKARLKYLKSLRDGDDSTSKPNGDYTSQRDSLVSDIRTHSLTFNYGNKGGENPSWGIHENYLVSPGVALESLLDYALKGKLDESEEPQASECDCSTEEGRKNKDCECILKMYSYNKDGKFDDDPTGDNGELPEGTDDNPSAGVESALGGMVTFPPEDLYKHPAWLEIDDKYRGELEDGYRNPRKQIYRIYVTKDTNEGSYANHPLNSHAKCVYDANLVIQDRDFGGNIVVGRLTKSRLDRYMKRGWIPCMPVKDAADKGIVNVKWNTLKPMYGSKQDEELPEGDPLVTSGLTQFTVQGPSGFKVTYGFRGFALAKKKGTISSKLPGPVVDSVKNSINRNKYTRYRRPRSDAWGNYTKYEESVFTDIKPTDDDFSIMVKTIRDNDGNDHLYVRRNIYKLKRRLVKNTRMVGGSRAFIHNAWSHSLFDSSANIIAMGGTGTRGVANAISKINNKAKVKRRQAAALATLCAGAGFIAGYKKNFDPKNISVAIIWGIVYAAAAFITCYLRARLVKMKHLWGNAGAYLRDNQVVELQKQIKVASEDEEGEYLVLRVRGLSCIYSYSHKGKSMTIDNFSIRDNDQGKDGMFSPPEAFSNIKFHYENWYERYWSRTTMPFTMSAITRSRGINRGALKYESYTDILLNRLVPIEEESDPWYVEHATAISVGFTLIAALAGTIVTCKGSADSCNLKVVLTTASLKAFVQQAFVAATMTYLVMPGFSSTITEGVKHTHWNNKTKNMIGAAIPTLISAVKGDFSGLGLFDASMAALNFTIAEVKAWNTGRAQDHTERTQRILKEMAEKLERDLNAISDCSEAATLLGEDSMDKECIRILNIDIPDTGKIIDDMIKGKEYNKPHKALAEKIIDKEHTEIEKDRDKFLKLEFSSGLLKRKDDKEKKDDTINLRKLGNKHSTTGN